MPIRALEEVAKREVPLVVGRVELVAAEDGHDVRHAAVLPALRLADGIGVGAEAVRVRPGSGLRNIDGRAVQMAHLRLEGRGDECVLEGVGHLLLDDARVLDEALMRGPSHTGVSPEDDLVGQSGRVVGEEGTVLAVSGSAVEPCHFAVNVHPEAASCPLDLHGKLLLVDQRRVLGGVWEHLADTFRDGYHVELEVCESITTKRLALGKSGRRTCPGRLPSAFHGAVATGD